MYFFIVMKLVFTVFGLYMFDCIKKGATRIKSWLLPYACFSGM